MNTESTRVCRHCFFAERDHVYQVKCLYSSTEYRPLRCFDCAQPILYGYNGNRVHDNDDLMFAKYQYHDSKCTNFRDC